MDNWVADLLILSTHYARRTLELSAKLMPMVIRNQNYSTCWIFGADGTNDQIRSKRPRTLEEFAYANCQEWPLAQLRALASVRRA